jgi:hypothetical protein
MRNVKPWIAVLAAAVMIAACANQKEPATKAIADAEAALAAIKDDAAKYVPENLSGVETTIAGLKDSLAKGDYKAVLAGAGGLTTAIASLKTAAEGKKAEMEAAVAAATTEWTSLSTDLPKLVEAIQGRMDILGKSKKLPKNLSQESYDSAKSGLEMIKSTWAEATTAFASGNVMDAVAKAKEVQTKGNEVLQLLGMGQAS